MQSTALFAVGINQYSRPNQLRGCVADIPATRHFLATYRGLADHAVKILTDKQATKRAILEGLQWLAVQGADVSVFVFSGHGTRVLDADQDEIDTRYDQAIVPVDFARAGLILDDDLRLVFSTFPSHTRIVMQLDSCFSAKAERGLLDYVRYGECRDRSIAPGRLTRKVIARTRENREMEDVFGIYGPQARGVLPGREIVLLSGCRDFETSADAYLGDGYRGAFSYFLQQAIRTLGARADYNLAIEDARRRLAVNGFAQVPQISGPPEWRGRPIYS